jgi:repressor LexA
MDRLTAHQSQILDFIRHQLVVRGFPPSYRDIGIAFGFSSMNSVNDHLRALERKGVVTRGPHGSRRTIRITDHGRAVLGLPSRAEPGAPVVLSTAPRVGINYGMRCGKCNAHTFTVDKPCAICRLERRRVA